MGFKRIAVGVLVYVFLCKAVAAVVLAQSAPEPAPEQLFSRANDLYRAAQYSEAVDTYEKIARQGSVNGNLYYNLGNSYFKKGDIGKAILNYERARQFIPYDSDLKANLDYARSLVRVNSSQYSRNRLLLWLHSLSDGLSVDAVTVFLSILFIGIFVLLTCHIFIPAIRKYTVFLLAGILIVFFAGAFSLYWKINYLTKGAVVIAKETQARFEPSENATAYFTLTEGNRVEVLDTGAHWFKIRRPDHKIGWVDKTVIELIGQ